MKSSTSTEEYDLLVLGSGTGGKILAGTFAQKGQRVIVIERKYVAGSCPNIACLPSKNIIHSAKVASFFYRSNEFGISKENVRINMAAVRERKRKMVANIVDIFRDHYYHEERRGTVDGHRMLRWPENHRSCLERRRHTHITWQKCSRQHRLARHD